MSKNLIWALIFVMTITLVGLIVMQTYWIKNAVEVKEKHFSQLVSGALSEVVKKIEMRQTLVEISNEVSGAVSTGEFQHAPDQLYISNNEFNKAFDVSISMGEEVLMIQKGDSLDVNTKYTIFSGDSMIYKVDNTTKRLDVFDPEIRDIYSRKEFQSHFKKNVSDKESFVQEVLNKLLVEDSDIEDRIKNVELDSMISEHLSDVGIFLNYEYGVSKSDSTIVLTSGFYDQNSEKDKYKIRLFPNDLLSDKVYLTVYFPKKGRYLYKSVLMIGGSSILLTVIIIFAFSFTTYIILRQRRLSEMKNDFVSTMTHELKTPISTISLASQMLKDNSIAQDLKNIDNISRIIDEESKRLSYQVEKVLQVAIFEKGKIRLKIKEIDINELITSVIKNFELQVASKSGSLKAELEAKNPMIFADEIHITNVVVNLIDNAMKYCRAFPDITVRTESKKKALVFSVIDNGIGIGKEDQKRIFEKFYRVSTGNVHNVKGFGLGLSYVKRIIDEHRWKVKIESELGKYTKFEIYIPNGKI